jgi:hypothetical protein
MDLILTLSSVKHDHKNKFNNFEEILRIEMGQ